MSNLRVFLLPKKVPLKLAVSDPRASEKNTVEEWLVKSKTPVALCWESKA